MYNLYFFDNLELQIGLVNDIEKNENIIIAHKIALFRDKLIKAIEGQELILKNNERTIKIKGPSTIEEKPIKIPGVAIYEYIDFIFVEELTNEKTL